MSTKVALIALAAAATTLAGCQGDKADTVQPAAGPAASPVSATSGVAALSADEILQRAKAALTRAKSYRAKGMLDMEGQKTTIDLKVSGENFTGSMSFGGAEVELLAVGGKKYLRPNDKFWIMSTDAEQGRTLARTIGDRWVAGADKDQSFADLFTVGSIEAFLKPTGALSKGEEKEVGGVPAIGLKDAGDPDSVLYVATTGEPYPLQLTGKGDSGMVFSDFGAAFTDIKAPAGDKVVDLGELAGK
ncbi:hypothetical protein [Couchioplanes caeruleus]|uniref:hypothetical protein n=1 Tax=Couchioplanes caeruleus TaxID=56438 RepID=UPI0011607EC7|nr:hypothetical protein [Couchioplanes caeruleus]